MSAVEKQIDLLVISTGRAASTAIYRYLDELANLRLPSNKEPHFWCDISRYGGVYPLLLDLVPKDEEGYWRLYSHSECVVDASVGYFFCLEEVIRNLGRAHQKPKVLFLYREPVSRASSFFNELKRKGLTGAKCIEDDIKVPRDPGLWWEYYYDNVDYYDNYIALTSYFEEILAVNYDFFSRNQAYVVSEILRFIDRENVLVDGGRLEPVNSSREAATAMYLQQLKRVGAIVPRRARRWIQRSILSFANRMVGNGESPSVELIPYLEHSLDQFKRFRDHIAQEDLMWLKRS